MTLLVVTDDGDLREPVHPTRLYWPYGMGVAVFGETVKHLSTVARCAQAVSLLHVALISCALDKK